LNNLKTTLAIIACTHAVFQPGLLALDWTPGMFAFLFGFVMLGWSRARVESKTPGQ
jgi:hypothetical protein